MKLFLTFLMSIGLVFAIDLRPFAGVDVSYGYHSHSFNSDVGSTSSTGFTPEVGGKIGLVLNKNHRIYFNYRYQFPQTLTMEMSETGTMTIPGSAIYASQCIVDGKVFGTENAGICTIQTNASSSQQVAIGNKVQTYYFSGFLYNGANQGGWTVSRGSSVITGYNPDTLYTYTAATFEIETKIALHKFVLGYDYIFNNGIFVGISGGIGKANGEALIKFNSSDISFYAKENISYTATILGGNVGYLMHFDNTSKLNIGIKGEYISAGNQKITVQAQDLSRSAKEYTFKPKEYNVGLFVNYNFQFGSSNKTTKKVSKKK